MIELKSWQFVLFLYEFFPRSNLNFFCGVNLLPLLSYFRAGFFVRPSKKLKGIKTQENNSKLKQKP